MPTFRITMPTHVAVVKAACLTCARNLVATSRPPEELLLWRGQSRVELLRDHAEVAGPNRVLSVQLRDEHERPNP